MRRIGRWLVIGAACVIALLLVLVGGIVMSSNANAHRPLDMLAGRLMWAAAAGMVVLGVAQGIRPSPLGSKLLLGAVLAATIGVCVLIGFVVGPW
jgi:hypothetical protein